MAILAKAAKENDCCLKYAWVKQNLFKLRNTVGRKNKWTQAMNTARLEVKRGFLTTRTLVTLTFIYTINYYTYINYTINVEVLERSIEENEGTE